MHDLVSGKNGRVYVSPTPLVCIRGREEYDDTTSLGYAFLPSDQIFPFLELRSAAVDRSRKRKERHRAAFTVIAFAIFYAGHGEDNYKIFKAFLAPED